MTLEGHAARRAATRIAPNQPGQLQGTNHSLGEAVNAQPADVAAFLLHNRQFHALIIRLPIPPG